MMTIYHHCYHRHHQRHHQQHNRCCGERLFLLFAWIVFCITTITTTTSRIQVTFALSSSSPSSSSSSSSSLLSLSSNNLPRANLNTISTTQLLAQYSNQRDREKDVASTGSTNYNGTATTCTAMMETTKETKKPLFRQTLFFRDAVTNVPIHIIGTMHYNPSSIQKTTQILHYYGQQQRLGAVILESCPTRWQLLQHQQPPGSILRTLLQNEFQTAAEIGAKYKIAPEAIVLADEEINQNDQRITKAFVSSVHDVLHPFTGGWSSIVTDLRTGYRDHVVVHNDNDDDAYYLTLHDVFDLNMVVGTPVTILRYLLAIVQRKPIKGGLIVCWLSLLVTLLWTRVGFEDGGTTLLVASLYGLFGSLLVTVPLFGRVYLFALLRDRNSILAENIRTECLRMQTTTRITTPTTTRIAEDTNNTTTTTTTNDTHNNNSNHGENSTTNSDTNSRELVAAKNSNGTNNDQVCVVVLGLAHCNGVKRELVS